VKVKHFEFAFRYLEIKTVEKIDANIYGFVLMGYSEFLLPVTVAKFIIKSSLIILKLNLYSSAGTEVDICR